MKTEFDREEFFDLCWEKSIAWFCKNYLITYHEFKGLCTKYQIPLPPNGYWMKRRYGIEVSKPALPGSEETGKIKLLLKNKENLLKSNPIAIGMEHNQFNFIVPKKLPKNPDPIIQEMLSNNPRRHPVVSNTYDYTKRYDYGRISVSASGSAYNRALCFLDTFIKVLKSKGYYFLFCYERSYVVIEGIEIAIRMRERSKRVYSVEKSGYRNSKLESIGLLSFIAGEYTGKEWQEKSTKTIAEKLPGIINYLEESAKEERRWKVENEKRLKKEAVEKRKQEEKENFQKEEIKKLCLLKQKSDLWHEAKNLRSFLSAWESNNLTEEMKELVMFGYQKADFLDPLVRSKDELFKDFDPYALLQILQKKN